MPITPNTTPETTVDKNGKTTTVHRKNGARVSTAKSGSGKSARSVPAPAAATTGQDEEVLNEQLKNVGDVRVGDIVWDGERGFAVTDKALRNDPNAAGRYAPRVVALGTPEGAFWYVNTKEDVLVLRDEEVLAEKTEEADRGWSSW